MRTECVRYYGNQIQKTDYNLDTEELKKYFPLETVVSGMLDIYQRLLGLKFTEIGNRVTDSPDSLLYTRRNNSIFTKSN